MSLVKKIITEIAKSLTRICNIAFQTGVVPNCMKVVKVIPLFKSAKHLFTNDRPVSLLSQFSKILEKLYNNQFGKFIEQHNLLNDSQYSFRANRFTALALLAINDYIGK